MREFRVNSMHPDAQAAKRRQYTRDNRELWKALGYRMMSTMVHDSDRDEVLAEIEVRRSLRARQLAEASDSNTATISHLSSRNISPSPTQKEMRQFLRSEEFENCLHPEEIEFCIEHAVAAKGRYHACVNAEAITGEGDAKWRLYAKQVANGNLAAAWWRLAMVRFENSDRKSIFMAKVDE